MNCPLCGSPSAEILHRQVADFEHGLPVYVDFHRCLNCSVVFLWPQPSHDELASYYPADYRPHEAAHRSGRKKPILSRLKDIQASMLVRKFLKFLPRKSDPIADLGCGGGNFLAALRSAGFTRLTGIDRVKGLAPGFANSGIEFVVADLENGIPTMEKFQTIVLNYALEHFLAPEKVLRECKKVLEPRGQILILTPNADSLSHAIFGRFWSGLHSPRHVQIHTLRSLRVLAEKTGYHLSDHRYLNDPASWAISMQNLVRSHVPGATPAAGTKWYTILSLPLWAPWALLEVLCGRGSSLIVRLRDHEKA